MSTNSVITDLEKRIDHYYDGHSAKRVAMATFSVGFVSIGLCWATYYFTLNVLIATGVFAVGSLLTVNLVMYVIIPPTKQLAASKQRMLGALNNPLRIKSVNNNKVALADSRGEIRGLSRLEQQVWDSIVIPHLIKMSAEGESASTPVKAKKLSNTEQIVMKKRQAEMIASRKELLTERKQLYEQRAALDVRAKELKKMQNQLEDRVSRVEASESDVVRLKANLQRRMQESENTEVGREELALLQEKAAELKAKELALESAKQELADDRDQLKVKKQQLDGMNDTLQSGASATGA